MPSVVIFISLLLLGALGWQIADPMWGVIAVFGTNLALAPLLAIAAVALDYAQHRRSSSGRGGGPAWVLCSGAILLVVAGALSLVIHSGLLALSVGYWLPEFLWTPLQASSLVTSGVTIVSSYVVTIGIAAVIAARRQRSLVRHSERLDPLAGDDA